MFAQSASAAEPESTPAPAERANQSQTLPTAEELFERHIEAIGGREMAFAAQHRRMVGRFEYQPVEPPGDVFRARLLMVQQAPDKLWFELNVPGEPPIITVFDGEIGWTRRGDGSYELIGGPQLIDLALSAHFHGEAEYERRYREFGQTERVLVNQKPAYRVAYTTVFGKPGQIIFDQESGLAIVIQTIQIIGDQPTPMIVRLEDYQPVDEGGLRYPRTIIQQTERAITTFTYRSVTHKVDQGPDWVRPEPVKARLEEITARQKELEAQRERGEGQDDRPNPGE